jgi:hypothetical protein
MNCFLSWYERRRSLVSPAKGVKMISVEIGLGHMSPGDYQSERCEPRPHCAGRGEWIIANVVVDATKKCGVVPKRKVPLCRVAVLPPETVSILVSILSSVF